MEPIVGFKPRSDALFVTSNAGQAAVYGSPHLIFPIGDFDIAYNEGIYDLYLALRGNMHALSGMDKSVLLSALERALGKPFEGNEADVLDFLGYIWHGDRNHMIANYFDEQPDRNEWCIKFMRELIPEIARVEHNSFPVRKGDGVEMMLSCKHYYSLPNAGVVKAFGSVDEFYARLTS